MNDPHRDYWRDDWEVRTFAMIGQEWPALMVEHWQENGVGERRLIDTRMYVASAISASSNAYTEPNEGDHDAP